MKGGTQAAVAVGIGYLLGRRRKFRRAAILAAVTASGQVGGIGKALAGRGLKALGSTELIGKLAPQFGDIADTARNELLDAGKTAARAVVNKQVDSLSDSLRARADVLRDPAAAGTGVIDVLRGGRRDQGDGRDQSGRRDEPEDREEARSRRGGGVANLPKRGGQAADRDDEDEDRDEDEDTYDEEYEAADENGDGYEDDDRYEDEYDDRYEDEYADEDEGDDQEEPSQDGKSAPTRRRRRTGVTASPVSRAGR